MAYDANKYYRAELLTEWKSEANRNLVVAEDVLRANGIGWENLREASGSVGNVIPDPNICMQSVDRVSGGGLNALEAAGVQILSADEVA